MKATGLSTSVLAKIELTCLARNVYGPSEDSFALADALLARSATWVLPPQLCVEIGSGSGYVITSLARILEALGKDVSRLIATDISSAALAATRATIVAHEVRKPYEVEVVQADLLGSLLSEVRQKVDLLLFNPPYVPTPEEEISQGGIAAAWAGGSRGRVVVDRLLAQLDEILSPSGELLLVTIAQNDPQELIAILEGRGFQAKICLTRQADEELLQILCVQRKHAAHH